MTPEDRHERLCDLVDRALDLDEDDRERFLDDECDDDEELRQEVEGLLAEATTGRGSSPPGPLEALEAIAGSMPKPPRAGPPSEIGGYRISRLLGAGGMGAVYLAEQDEPVQRQVALKLVHTNLQGPGALARFGAERNALARLSHPHVARLFAAGTTPDGFPYFAMEHVPEGEGIARYCDRQRLPIEARLRLFVQACQGVQHAHQKGILHRDLKPGNVLVTEVDGFPCAKVIDFGLAKALDHPLTADAPALTRFGLLGTPAYMSPEAREGSPDIDTRTDVYSLGILLHELLTGVRPKPHRDPRSTPRERPSTRVGSLDAVTTSRIAERRQLSVATLAGRLRGDLDWIVMTAIAAEPERRYASVADLAADIERHLDDRPVLARPPSRGYRLRKFVRRHQVGVAATLLVGAALVFGIVGTSIAAVAARRAEQQATAQAAVADLEAATATAVVELLVDLFEVSDPSQARGSSITALELLAQGTERLERDLADQPSLLVEMLGTISGIYAQLGDREAAVEVLDRALSLARRHDTGQAEAISEMLSRWRSAADRAQTSAEELRPAQPPNSSS